MFYPTYFLTIGYLLTSGFQELHSQKITTGTSFIFGFNTVFIPPTNAQGISGYHGICRVIVSSASGSRAIVAVPGLGISSQLTIPAGGVQVTDLTNNTRQTPGVVQTLAVTVTADSDVSVYIVNQADVSTDGTPVFPVSVLGTEYIASSYEPAGGHNSQISVVSNTAGTTVQLFKPDFINVYVLNSTVTLGQFQTYLFEDGNNDLTGWKVVSNNPVAVFGGHVCSEIQNPGTATSGGSCELLGSLLWEMMPATSLWSTDYIVPPVHMRPAYPAATSNNPFFRVVAKAATHIEMITRGQNFTISQAGEFLMFNHSLTQYDVIRCDVECLLVHYMRGFRYDPAMTVVPSISKYTDNYILGALFVNTPGTQATSPTLFIWEHNVVLVVNQANQAAVSVVGPSGSVTPAAYTSINDTDYVWTSFGSITAPAAAIDEITVSCTDCMVMLQSYVTFDSYAYIGGWGSSTPATTPPEENSSSSPIGIIIGVIIGFLVVGGIIVAVVLYLKKKKSGKAKTGAYETGEGKSEGDYRPRTQASSAGRIRNMARGPDVHYTRDPVMTADAGC